MSDVLIDLNARRTQRDDDERERQMLRAAHPSLRWVAGLAFYVAHRRAADGSGAHCGARGDLVLAPPGVPLCVECYPLRDRPSRVIVE